MHALEAGHAPVVWLWVWYQVGGRTEVPGTTGMSHFLEHMLFKGTPRHPKGDLDKLLARYGALWNAFTSEDVTCYFETVPAERYPVALDLEADRMRNALITVEETEAERNVIVSEREGLENDPSFLLGEQLQSVAFARHPYAQGVIGSKEEIKLMTRDGLYAHYRRHYAPNNAYFIVAGDAPADELLDRAASAFGSLDAEVPIEPPKAPEPPQYGEKRVMARKEEITLMTRAGLSAHSGRPSARNTVYFIAAGAAPADGLLDRAASAFGSLDAEVPIEPQKAREPPQYGEKRVIVRRAG